MSRMLIRTSWQVWARPFPFAAAMASFRAQSSMGVCMTRPLSFGQRPARLATPQTQFPTAIKRVGGAPKRGLAEVRVGDDYQKGQEDQTTTLTLEVPFGHEENKTLANQLGIYKVWEYEDGGRKSMFTMAFQGRDGLDPELWTLDKFLEADNEMKLKQVPSGQTESTTLPPDVTQYFSQVKVPFGASIFRSNTEGASDSLVFCFQTPGGYWTIAWHVSAELFLNEPDLFFLFLQTIRLSPKTAQ